MVASVGPYRFVNLTCGSRRIQWIKGGVGKTSPHHNNLSSDGKSLNLTTSALAMKFKTEGTENHCVNSEARMNSANLCGARFNSAGTMCSCAPDPSVP